jgi:PTS system fructose-specific IIA component
MAREILNLKQAAEHVHLPPNELKHFAQRGEIEAFERNGEWFFEHRQLDEWAQREMLASGRRGLAEQHKVMMEENRRAQMQNWGVAELFSPQSISLEITAKAKAGILRDMTDLAVKSGHVNDPDGLFKELVAREEAASTAIGEEVALLHPRFHDPYLFDESFIAYGRAERPVFFGAPNGEATRHFFLICSTDHKAHLHILARLAMLAHGSDLTEKLNAAEDPEEVAKIIAECESEYKI